MVLPALRAHVASLTAYDVDLGAPGVHVGMPSTTLTLVLPVGEPLDVGWARSPGSRTRGWSIVSGLHAHPAEIHHDGVQRGIQVGLTTAGARALLGVPAAALAGQLAGLEDVAPDLRHLPEQLATALTWAERERLVEAALLGALTRHGAAAPRAEVARALRALTRGTGVAEVADEVGYSRRRLSTLVREECGLAPKEYQRVARFATSQRLLVRAARAGRPSLAAVGAQAGYADQAHLAREWHRLAGCSPSAWLREEFPFVQDAAAHADAG